MLLVLSVVLIFIGYKSPYHQRFRSYLAKAVYPLYYVVDKPIKGVSYFTQVFSEKNKLIAQNESLNSQLMLAGARIQGLLSLKLENQQLRKLLGASASLSEHVLISELLAVSQDPFRGFVIINKGRHAHVFIGQAVLDAYGVMGQVTEVGDFASRVLLITDSQSAVPVVDVRSGLRSLVVGTGDNTKMSMIYVPDTADIKLGDVLNTSGLGLRYPAGYPVGKIISIKRTSKKRFSEITIVPIAHIMNSRYIMLLWPSQADRIKSAKKLLSESIGGMAKQKKQDEKKTIKFE